MFWSSETSWPLVQSWKLVHVDPNSPQHWFVDERFSRDACFLDLGTFFWTCTCFLDLTRFFLGPRVTKNAGDLLVRFLDPVGIFFLDLHVFVLDPGEYPASRGVAAHTAGLFRSVRGAKGGFPPWGLPKLRIFTFPPPPWGLPKLGNFHFSPPWGLPKLGNFHFSPPWGLPKLGNFHFSPPWGLPKLGNFHFSPPWGLPKLGNFHFSPPWGLPKLGNFHFSPPWQLPKLWNFHFSLPWRLSKLRNFK